MASVKIRRSELACLPAVCTSCGKEATTEKSEKYNWNPSWVFLGLFVGLLPWLLFMVLTRRSVTIAMPVCDRHLHRGKWPMRILAGGLALAGVVGAVGFALGEFGGRAGDAVWMSCVGIILLTGLIAICTTNNLHASAIDDRAVTLEGVSKEFADAVGQDRPDRPRRSATAPAGGTELMTAKYLR